MNLTFRMLQHTSSEVTVTRGLPCGYLNYNKIETRRLIPNKESNDNEKGNENKQT